ncbi:metallophosphoesterase family protein [Peptoniphilus sp. MSJ-1]|uniref:Metallophosphoesterase family protein n=1 Tax=Peptoniphilus ovalis TaxID=2841503 RepID=A0ABS6FJG5_9FIRM|nr:metallophosphoesterase [Peptoniphilus ovalis]MBU5669345.1 metallophosphoesterase family protein [Peptoniphilus ovalis]
MKIIHISDLHLKRFYKGKLPLEISNILLEDTWKALVKASEYSNKIKAEIFLISGDLFEKEFFNLKDLNRLFDIIKNISAKVFIVFGNHDYMSNDNIFGKVKLPENLYIFNSELSFYEMEELNTRIYGVSYNNFSFLKNFEMPELDKNYINIGLFHNDFNDERYLMLNLDELKDFDYVALGHVHKRQRILKNVYYGGSIIPLSFKDEGPRGGIVFDTDTKEADFVNFSEREFIKLPVDIDKNMNLNDILSNIQSDINDKNLYRIILNGNHNNFMEVESFLNNNIKAFYFEIKNNLKPAVSLDEIIKSEDYLNDFFNSFSNSELELESKNMIKDYILEQYYEI